MLWRRNSSFVRTMKGEGRRRPKLQGSTLKVLMLNIFFYVFCPLQMLHSQNFSYSLFLFRKCLFWLLGWTQKWAHKHRHRGTHKHRSKAGAARRIPSQVQLHEWNWEENLAHWLLLTPKVVTLILSLNTQEISKIRPDLLSSCKLPNPCLAKTWFYKPSEDKNILINLVKNL